MEEKKLFEFYQAMVDKSQKNKHGLELFFEQAIMCMMLGHEFGDKGLTDPKLYELLFIINLSLNSKSSETGSILHPFDMVDNEYYMSILDNPNILRKLMFFERMYEDLTSKKGKHEMLDAFQVTYPEFLETFKEICGLRNIIRTGWIQMEVNSDYLESDTLHTAQMFGLASAYFRLYNPEDLDRGKVLEMILVHEVGEILAGDICEKDPKHDSKHDIEEQGVRQVFGKMKNGEYYIGLWNEFEARKSNEAKFSYQTDKIDPVMKSIYLDGALDRTDLYPEFYDYEYNRGTFDSGYLKKVFKYMERKGE